MSSVIRRTILDAAAALDAGDLAEARRVLLAAPVGEEEAHSRRIYLALWRRVLSEEDASKTAGPPLDALDAVIGDAARIWEADAALRRLEDAAIDPAWLAALAAVLLWPETLTGQKEFFPRFFDIVSRGDVTDRTDAIWTEYLRRRVDYTPNHWTHLTAIRARGLQALPDFPDCVTRELRELGREDLAPLAAVQLGFMVQGAVETCCRQALALDDPTHRAVVAEYLLGGPMRASDAAAMEAALLTLLSDDAPFAEPMRRLMRARAATALGSWEEAEAAAADVTRPANVALVAASLGANAKARLGRYDAARLALRRIARAKATPPHILVRTRLIGAVTELLEAGGAPPESLATAEMPEMPVMAGRPLAQSLWVGPRLRWVEQLSIASYLRNGWRYQLYVYDTPANVPAGVEIMDAEAILPRSALFREGGSSGWHKGSLGAFSDLFRYALLLRRGGMWTDTDVLNRRRFEPDGRSFMSTELIDGGLYGPNGALLAAPAGSPFMAEALRRAEALIGENQLRFARIGPELLAEMIAERGLSGFELLPRCFMNPIPWMSAAWLLAPAERIARLPEIQAAANIHLYTETWRLVGLSLEAPPGPETFLGQRFVEIMGQDAMREAMQMREARRA